MRLLRIEGAFCIYVLASDSYAFSPLPSYFFYLTSAFVIVSPFLQLHDNLLFLKSATNSHADYYCCLDTLFDDSLATSDVIIYE